MHGKIHLYHLYTIVFHGMKAMALAGGAGSSCPFSLFGKPGKQ